jgi:hypothetical protein
MVGQDSRLCKDEVGEPTQSYAMNVNAERQRGRWVAVNPP